MRTTVFLFTALFLASCSNTVKVKTTDPKEDWIMQVGETKVPTEEFIYAYTKNNFNRDSVDIDADVREYLDLYVKFKLKVEEGKTQGIDTTQAFREEFVVYQKQLAEPYLTETRVSEQLVEEAYNRMTEEVRAAHILIRVSQNAPPEDTLKAYNRIQDIRKQALGGRNFAELAVKYSEDPSVSKNKGELGYFSALQMVYPFESAAYNTEVGQVSEILRTNYGYHILKVEDKRPAPGRVRVSHLMIVARDGLSPEDTSMAKLKIEEIRAELDAGGDWNELCSRFSEDRNTRYNGGQLPWISRGNYPTEFEQAAYGLEDAGDISDPVKTRYGWHIIKLEEKEPLKSFEEMKPALETRISRDSRSNLSQQAFISRLKRENKFVPDQEALDQVLDLADSSLLSGDWTAPLNEELASRNIFMINNKSYPVTQFTQFAQQRQRPVRNVTPREQLQRLYDSFEEDQLIAYEEEHLEEKYLDYRMLIREYREGIMLFQLMEENVWSMAEQDTVGLENYFEQNIEKYQWPERLEMTVYNAISQDIIDEINSRLQSGDTLVQVKSLLDSMYNQKSTLNLQVDRDEYSTDEFPYMGQIKKEPGRYLFEADQRYYLVDVIEVLPPGPMELEETRGKVIADYQEELEKAWIEELRRKYPLSVREDAVEQVIYELKKS